MITAVLLNSHLYIEGSKTALFLCIPAPKFRLTTLFSMYLNNNITPYHANILVQKISSAYCLCCINLNALQIDFFLESEYYEPYQNRCAAWSMSNYSLYIDIVLIGFCVLVVLYWNTEGLQRVECCCS